MNGGEGYRPIPVPLLGRFIEANSAARDLWWKLVAYAIVAVLVVVAYQVFFDGGGVSAYEQEHNCTVVGDPEASACIPNDELPTR